MDQALFRILGILLLSQVAPKECHSTTGTFFKASNAIKGGSSDTPELDEGVFACERTKGCSIIGKLEGSSRYQAQANTDNDPSKFSSLLQKVDTEAKSKVSAFKDCRDAYLNGNRKDGRIELQWKNGSTYTAYCNMSIDEGGWTVFQRRVDPSLSFNRNWKQYADGFGTSEGNFWLGLEALHQLTSQGRNVTLRIDLKDKTGQWGFAKYSDFRISGAADEYRLQVGGWSGNRGDSLTYSNGMPFSSPDRDNDLSSNNCAEKYDGSWWFKSCFRAHLNGLHYDTVPPPFEKLRMMSWYTWAEEMGTITYSEMKLKVL